MLFISSVNSKIFWSEIIFEVKYKMLAILLEIFEIPQIVLMEILRVSGTTFTEFIT